MNQCSLAAACTSNWKRNASSQMPLKFPSNQQKTCLLHASLTPSVNSTTLGPATHVCVRSGWLHALVVVSGSLAWWMSCSTNDAAVE